MSGKLAKENFSKKFFLLQKAVMVKNGKSFSA
jgi:hypothetical protein